MSQTEQPCIDEVLEHPAPALNEDDAKNVLLDHFGIRGRLGPLDSERDQNFLIETAADGASS